MSVEAGDVAGIAGGTLSVATVVWWLVQRAIKKGDLAEAKLATDLEARVAHLEKRLEGVAESHRQQLEELKRTAVEHDTRLRFREGGYGANPLAHTNPGMKLTPEQLAEARRLYAETKDGFK